MEFEELLGELRKEASQAAWHIGFLKVAVEESELIASRLNDSYSGYAGIIAESAVKASVILYCARAWDMSSDAVSLRRMLRHLPPLENLLQHKVSRLSESGIDVDKRKFEDRYNIVMDRYREIENDGVHSAVRVLRTEFFAHRIIESKDRHNLKAAGQDVSGLTYDSLLKLAIGTVMLVGEIGYLRDGLANPFRGQLSYAEECCREFWKRVPRLSEAEDPR